MGNSIASLPAVTAADAVEALQDSREHTLALVQSISDEDLRRVHSPLMSPLVWDLGHIAAYEDLWLVHRFGGRPLLREDLATIYDAFETPRAGRGGLDFLRPAAAREYLAEVRSRTLAVIEQRGVGDGVLHEMVVRHEQQHGETMLQAIGLARLEDYRLCLQGDATAPETNRSTRSSRGPGDGTRACRDPGRAVHHRRRPRRLRLRQRAPAPPNRRARLPDRPHPDHERNVPAIRRGRRV